MSKPAKSIVMVLKCAACGKYMHPTEPNWNGCAKATGMQAIRDDAHDYHWTSMIRAEVADATS